MKFTTEAHRSPDDRFFGVDDRWATVAVFSSMLATGTGAWYHILRMGLHDKDLWPVLKIVSLSYFLICAPLVWRATACKGSPSNAWFGLSSANCRSFAALLLVIIGGIATPYFGLGIGTVFCVLGVLLLAATFVTWLPVASPRQTLVFLCGAGALSACMGLAVLGGYNDPLFLESLVVGRTHLDQLDFAAFISIIKTYGIPSTGLDGTPYCPYHWVSMWISAQISTLLDVDAITFVNLGYPAIFIPLLINAMLSFTLDFAAYFANSDVQEPLRAHWLFWALLFVALMGFVPREASSLMVLGLPSSQTMGMSLLFLFVISSLMLSLTEIVKRGGLQPRISEFILVVAVIPVLFAVLTMTKLSTGFLAALVYGYLFLRLGLYRSPTFVTSVLLTALATVLALKQATGLANPEEAKAFIYPFHYVVNFVPAELRTWFFVIHFFWSWAFLLAAMYLRGIRTLGDFRDRFRGNETVDMEIVLLLCLAGAAPGLVLAIAGGSALFFSQVQQWIAVSLVLANLAPLSSKLFPQADLRSTAGRSLWHVRVKSLFACVIAITVGAAVLHAVGYSCAYSVYRNVSIRLCLCRGASVETPSEVGCGGKEWAGELKNRLFTSLKGQSGETPWHALSTALTPLFTEIQGGLEQSRHYPMMKALLDLNKLSIAHKRESLVFIPQSNKAYWDMIRPDLVMALDYPGCKAAPFISPAVTGIASLDGMPIQGCDLRGFHYSVYAPRTRNQTENDTTPESLCVRARARGFARVITIGYDSRGQLRVSPFSCDDSSMPRVKP
jgi:hypothetical protein